MLERYRSYYSWQESIKLGLLLYRLADDLPGEEQHLLAHDLRRAAVDVPTLIAQNILSNQPPDLAAMVKLSNVMELITRVYPALDTSATEEAIRLMSERMNDTGRFMEMVPAPAAVPAPEPEEDEDEDDEDDDDEEESSDVHIGVNQG